MAIGRSGAAMLRGQQGFPQATRTEPNKLIIIIASPAKTRIDIKGPASAKRCAEKQNGYFIRFSGGNSRYRTQRQYKSYRIAAQSPGSRQVAFTQHSNDGRQQ